MEAELTWVKGKVRPERRIGREVSKVVILRVPGEQWTKLMRIAKRDGSFPAKVIREAIEEWLKKEKAA